jgi:hypothetical protein
MLQKIRRRDIILLSWVFLLACFSVLVVTILILRNQPGRIDLAAGPGPTSTPGPEPTHTVSFVQVTGMNRYSLAENAARAWAADAQLVSANANWPRVTRLDHVGEPASWTYRFYSPGQERLFFVDIQPDGQLQTIEHAIPITLPPSLIPADAWVIDSPAALAIWLDYGGSQMLRTNPGLELLVQLRRVGHYPDPVWMIVGLDSRTEDVLMVMIDANQGVVVSTQP